MFLFKCFGCSALSFLRSFVALGRFVSWDGREVENRRASSLSFRVSDGVVRRGMGGLEKATVLRKLSAFSGFSAFFAGAARDGAAGHSSCGVTNSNSSDCCSLLIVGLFALCCVEPYLF